MQTKYIVVTVLVAAALTTLYVLIPGKNHEPASVVAATDPTFNKDVTLTNSRSDSVSAPVTTPKRNAEVTRCETLLSDNMNRQGSRMINSVLQELAQQERTGVLVTDPDGKVLYGRFRGKDIGELERDAQQGDAEAAYVYGTYLLTQIPRHWAYEFKANDVEQLNKAEQMLQAAFRNGQRENALLSLRDAYAMASQQAWVNQGRVDKTTWQALEMKYLTYEKVTAYIGSTAQFYLAEQQRQHYHAPMNQQGQTAPNLRDSENSAIEANATAALPVLGFDEDKKYRISDKQVIADWIARYKDTPHIFACLEQANNPV